MPERDPSRSRSRNLRAQAGVRHTFGPLLIPLAIILLGSGGFLLESSITHGLESDAAPVLFGSVIFACGLLLVSFLLPSIRISSHFGARNEASRTPKQSLAHVNSPGAEDLPNATPPSRSFHISVDETRVSR